MSGERSARSQPQSPLLAGHRGAKVAKRKDKEGRNHREHREHGEKRTAKREERSAKDFTVDPPGSKDTSGAFFSLNYPHPYLNVRTA